MDFILDTSEQVIVSFKMTREELQRITNGIGRTSHNSRVDAGMQPSESDAVAEFFWELDNACHCNGIKTDYE